VKAVPAFKSQFSPWHVSLTMACSEEPLGARISGVSLSTVPKQRY